MVEKRTEKNRKYVDLSIKIKTLGNVNKLVIVLIIFGANVRKFSRLHLYIEVKDFTFSSSKVH